MKGTIVKCLKELVVNRFGADKWTAICQHSDFPPNQIINLSADIEDAKVMSLIGSTCSVLGITLEQAADAFGDYWVNDYAVVIYKHVYDKFSSCREFILGMDGVHVMVTKMVPNSSPPRFTYEFKDDKTLIMKYESNRGLIAILAGLVKGLGRYFKENLTVTRLDDKTLRVVFP